MLARRVGQRAAARYRLRRALHVRAGTQGAAAARPASSRVAAAAAASPTPAPSRTFGVLSDMKNWLKSKIAQPGSPLALPPPRKTWQTDELNAELSSLVRDHKYDAAERVAAAAVSGGTKLSGATYRVLMEAAAGARSYTRVLALYDEMVERKLNPSGPMFAQLLVACQHTKNEARARAVWQAMQTNQIERRSAHLAPYLLTIAETRNVAALKAAQDELRWRDVKLPFDVYTTVARVYLDADETFYAHIMLENARKAYANLPASLFQRILVSAMKSSPPLPAVAMQSFRYLQSAKDSSGGDVLALVELPVLHTLLVQLCKEQQLLADLNALIGFFGARSLPMPRNVAGRVVQTLLEHDMLPSALSVIGLVERTAAAAAAAAAAIPKPSSAASASASASGLSDGAAAAAADAEYVHVRGMTWTAARDQWAPLRTYASRHIERARALYTEVVKRKHELKLPITASMVNACLYAFAELREFERALVTFEEFGDVFGLQPTISSYNALLSACVEKRRVKSFAKFYALLLADTSVQPDVFTRLELVCHRMQLQQQQLQQPQQPSGVQQQPTGGNVLSDVRGLLALHEWSHNERKALYIRVMRVAIEQNLTELVSALEADAAADKRLRVPVAHLIADARNAARGDSKSGGGYDGADADGARRGRRQTGGGVRQTQSGQSQGQENGGQQRRIVLSPTEGAEREARRARHALTASLNAHAPHPPRIIDETGATAADAIDGNGNGGSGNGGNGNGGNGNGNGNKFGAAHSAHANTALGGTSSYRAAIVTAPFDPSKLALSTNSNTTPNALFGHLPVAPAPEPLPAPAAATPAAAAAAVRPAAAASSSAPASSTAV